MELAPWLDSIPDGTHFLSMAPSALAGFPGRGVKLPKEVPQVVPEEEEIVLQ